MPRESGTRDKRQVGNPHEAWRQSEHSICTGQAAPFVSLDKVSQETRQLDSEHGLPLAPDLLHQHAVDKLKETPLAGTNPDDILFGGRPKWRIAANPPG